MSSSSRVAYYYHDEVGDYSYGPDHPMKPHRIRLAHNLIGGYGLLDRMSHFEPVRLAREEMVKFHAEDYIDFLQEVRPQHQQLLNAAANPDDEDESAAVSAADIEAIATSFRKFGVDGDCPIFDGLYKYCEIYSGGSVGGAWKLNRGAADIAINWAGGLHHAKKAECSGFCYTNDIVLAILELLRYHSRVLYIDIDVHHGDGVEEAFYTTDRVMTVSFHRHGDGFFPCTGALEDRGVGAGKNHSLNFPLADGIDDDTYQRLFRSIIGGVMESYKPDAIVLQCGADSLTGDKLGPFNLTLRGHGSCVQYCKGLGVPLLLLGGGGYTVQNVARAWTFETAIAIGVQDELNADLPFNAYIHHWSPDYKLHIEPMAERENRNDRDNLQRIESQLLQQLRELGGPPSVPYDTKTGRDEALHGWKEEVAAAQREQAQMDGVGDGAAVGGRQHVGEFFANNRDQDGTTMPVASNGMGIVRAKPSVPLRNNNGGNEALVKAEGGAAPMEQ